MSVFKPFAAWRPHPEFVEQVAALPYDVMSSEEARQMVAGKPWSFLHVDKPEIDMDPGIDLYDARVYQQARTNLQRMMEAKILLMEEQPCYYIYRQRMGDHVQTGLAGVVSIDDYINNIVKKHEFTRPDKEADRTRHVDICDAQTGPIFLSYRTDELLRDCLRHWTDNHDPLYEIDGGDGVLHIIWRVDEADAIDFIKERFAAIPYLYIADGHHRAASAVNVGKQRREQQSHYHGDEAFNFFMAVSFPADELQIFDYNRLVKDLNGYEAEELLSQIAAVGFKVLPWAAPEHCRPPRRHNFGLYLKGRWYLVEALPEVIDESDPVAGLDVSILQDKILAPLLGIDDPRTSQRIDFVGGIRGLDELVRRVDSGEMEMAFAMYPTGMAELMAIADAGAVMPPKSTWFEPKLRSGIFIHGLK